MLSATHTAHAPWCVVSFDDKRLGRLTLIRHLLASIPDYHLDDEPIVLPPLRGEPLAERFAGPVAPLDH